MKKLLCVAALLFAFQPSVFAQPHGRTTVSKTTVVEHRPGHTVRKTVVVRRGHHVERRVVVRHHHPSMVRCRDGVLRRDRPGACRGHGGRL